MILLVSFIKRLLTYDNDSMINTIYLISDDKVTVIQGDSRGNMNMLGDDIIAQLHNATSDLR